MAQISSIGYYLPEKVYSNEELLNEIATTCELKTINKLQNRLINNKAIKRHFISDGETHIDIAVKAAKNCMEKINFQPKDLDLIIYCGFLKDYMEPASSIMVQNKLDDCNAYCFDLANACNGFLTAMDQANTFIEAGLYENILLVTGEASYRYIPWNKFGDDSNIGFSALTVADGAGAMLFQKGGWVKNFALRDFRTYSQSFMYCLLPIDTLKMDVKSREMAITGMHIMPDFVSSFLARAEEFLEGIDSWYFHQFTGAPRNMFGNISDTLFSKYFNSFPDVGNTATASIPLGMALAEEQKFLKKGDKVVCLVGASGFTVGGLAFVY